MTLWEILKANKTGIAPNMFTMLAANKMNGGRDRLHELTGTPPLSFKAKGKPLSAWSITGNTVQNGTPTPYNPIMPEGCGELETVGTKAGQYKIPISSAEQTTPVYLGEVESTRQIKKLVLTGDELWQFYADDLGLWQFYINDISLGGVPISSCTSNIAPYGVTVNNRRKYDYGCYLITAGSGVAFQMNGDKDTLINANSWKSYLAAKYAAGTPVTVWYVLANEETAVVNEPLMKIGDYADTLSMEQAGVQIPTLNGTTVIDVDTAVKPESMTIKYRR